MLNLSILPRKATSSEHLGKSAILCPDGLDDPPLEEEDGFGRVDGVVLPESEGGVAVLHMQRVTEGVLLLDLKETRTKVAERDRASDGVLPTSAFLDPTSTNPLAAVLTVSLQNHHSKLSLKNGGY